MTPKDHTFIDTICSAIPELLRAEHKARLTAFVIQKERDAFNAGALAVNEALELSRRVMRPMSSALSNRVGEAMEVGK